MHAYWSQDLVCFRGICVKAGESFRGVVEIFGLNSGEILFVLAGLFHAECLGFVHGAQRDEWAAGRLVALAGDRLHVQVGGWVEAIGMVGIIFDIGHAVLELFTFQLRVTVGHALVVVLVETERFFELVQMNGQPFKVHWLRMERLQSNIVFVLRTDGLRLVTFGRQLNLDSSVVQFKALESDLRFADIFSVVRLFL